MQSFHVAATSFEFSTTFLDAVLELLYTWTCQSEVGPLNNSKKLLLAAACLLTVLSFPAMSTPVAVCTGVSNDFAPSEFGNCWSTAGNVTTGLAGIGPTIATSGGISSGVMNVFIGKPADFSNLTMDNVGTGSAIQDGLTLAGAGQLMVNFTTSSPSGSVGFVVVRDVSNSLTYFKLFDQPAGLLVQGVAPAGVLISLPAGSYVMTIGIANATQALTAFSNSSGSTATTGPAITGVTIQDVGTPEPGVAWLVASGLAGLALFRRRWLR